MHFLPKASYGTLERERERERGVGVVGELCSECVSSGTKTWLLENAFLKNVIIIVL